MAELLDIGVLDHKGEKIDAALRKTIELVASQVRNLRLPAHGESPNPSEPSWRVLVFAQDGDQRAQYIAERNYFGHTVGCPLQDEVGEGVFWVTEASDLDELNDSSFDAVLAFNVTHMETDDMKWMLSNLSRVVRPGGILAGTGAFRGVGAHLRQRHPTDAPAPLEARFSLSKFRHWVEDAGFFMQMSQDLSLDGHVVLMYEQEAKDLDENAAPEPVLTMADPMELMCARFVASKIMPDGTGMASALLVPAKRERKFSFSSESSVVPSPGLPAISTGLPTVPPVATAVLPPIAAVPQRPRVVVSGVSLGLPNATRGDCSVFDQRNFDRIFAGENCIAYLSDVEKQRILDQNVVQVLKVDNKRVRRKLKAPSEVIQLASKLGQFDLVKEYGIPSNVVETLDTTYKLAIAAGLEALKSAGIVLGGSSGFELPVELQDGTGVIFASSFPCTESSIDEAHKSMAYHVEKLLELKRAKELGLAATEKSDDKPDSYEFDRKLLFKLLVMANNQLAELIKARGPNTHVNAACASTTQAVAIAEDWIRLGRCHRVIVIGADNATSENLLPYLGTGFLALTAATTCGKLEDAACPFDTRRTGMILGMGAVGLMLESVQSARAREARPMCELIGSHFLNSAFHASLLDRDHIAKELKVFIDRIERDTGIDRQYIAKELIYFSHETFTCANGGCAKAEMDALAEAFGEAGKAEILVTNTKGFTGHPMGVGLEDAIAVASLDMGMVPPIAHHRETDPVLGFIRLSQGGAHNRSFGLRFAAGFGSQFVFLLFRKWSEAAERLAEAQAQALMDSCMSTNGFCGDGVEKGEMGEGADGYLDGPAALRKEMQMQILEMQAAAGGVSCLAEQSGELASVSPVSVAVAPDEVDAAQRAAADDLRRQHIADVQDTCSVM